MQASPCLCVKFAWFTALLDMEHAVCAICTQPAQFVRSLRNLPDF